MNSPSRQIQSVSVMRAMRNSGEIVRPGLYAKYGPVLPRMRTGVDGRLDDLPAQHGSSAKDLLILRIRWNEEILLENRRLDPLDHPVDRVVLVPAPHEDDVVVRI